MPLGDRTGPPAQSPSPGQGLGREGGRGRQPGGFGLGPGGECVCPNCGTRAPHQRGIPCYEQKCSSCGSPMTRTR